MEERIDQLHTDLITELEEMLTELKSTNKVAVKKFKRGKELVGSSPTRSLDIVYVKV